MAAAGASRLSAQEITQALREEIARLSDGKLSVATIDPSQHMIDCGYIDSLSAVILLAHIEDRYGVSIEDVELIDSLTTLEALAGHVAGSR